MAPNLPFGWYFKPTDAELMHFLIYKSAGVPLPSHDYIGSADLYGDDEPWQIIGDAEEEKELYFFTKLKKLGGRSTTTKNDADADYKRFSRNVGRGTWLNNGKAVPVFGKQGGGVVGHKRQFRYYRRTKEGGGGADGDREGRWVMKEYSLSEKWRVKEEYKDLVLCVLKRKRSNKGPYAESGLDVVIRG